MELRNMVSKKEFAEIKRSVIKELQQYHLIQTTNYFNQAPENQYDLSKMDPATKSLYEYCETLEKALDVLTEKERTVIEGRFLAQDSEYITDYEFYANRLNPPVCALTYTKIRDQAIMKLAPYLDGDSFCLKIEYKQQVKHLSGS